VVGGGTLLPSVVRIYGAHEVVSYRRMGNPLSGMKVLVSSGLMDLG
jgi:hypothetical protein